MNGEIFLHWTIPSKLGSELVSTHGSSDLQKPDPASSLSNMLKVDTSIVYFDEYSERSWVLVPRAALAVFSLFLGSRGPVIPL